ncbi:hypothetical protein [Parafrankia elaeagni]|uniref:hypothetical protein n=1 Tax=Parafrankia elaeagni TaxID=222534 RepID=UPI000A025CEC|nr:hypothetical protein [Parafrankia elaeagni]
MDGTRRSERRRGTRLRLASAGALITAVLTLAAGCDSGDGSQPAPTPSAANASTQPSAPVSPTPTSPADIARRDAVAAYLGMWKAYAQASHTSDWQAPYLSQYAAGDALQVITGNLYADHYNGLVAKGEPVNNPRVTSVTPEDAPKSVIIEDCGDDRNWLQYRTDGSLLNNTPGASHRIVAEVRLHADGKWRVTKYGIDTAGTCQ